MATWGQSWADCWTKACWHMGGFDMWLLESHTAQDASQTHVTRCLLETQKQPKQQGYEMNGLYVICVIDPEKLQRSDAVLWWRCGHTLKRSQPVSLCLPAGGQHAVVTCGRWLLWLLLGGGRGPPASHSPGWRLSERASPQQRWWWWWRRWWSKALFKTTTIEQR